MADKPTQPLPSDEPEFPTRLSAVLNRLHGTRLSVPTAIDAAILRDARAGFSRRRRFGLAVRWAGATAAAAAAVLVIALSVRRNPLPTNVATSALAGDLDGNGRVDILDAFVLARSVDAGSTEGPKAGDVNRDGAIDRRDVDAVAAMAVRLPGGVQ